MMERLAYLEGRGYAHSLGDDRWLLEPDFKERLKELQLDNDIIHSRAKVHKWKGTSRQSLPG